MQVRGTTPGGTLQALQQVEHYMHEARRGNTVQSARWGIIELCQLYTIERSAISYDVPM